MRSIGKQSPSTNSPPATRTKEGGLTILGVGEVGEAMVAATTGGVGSVVAERDLFFFFFRFEFPSFFYKDEFRVQRKVYFVFFVTEFLIDRDILARFEPLRTDHDDLSQLSSR